MGYLLVLACPVSMVLMMWMMMRGGTRASEDPRIGIMQRQIDALHAERDAEARDPERVRLGS